MLALRCWPDRFLSSSIRFLSCRLKWMISVVLLLLLLILLKMLIVVRHESLAKDDLSHSPYLLQDLIFKQINRSESIPTFPLVNTPLSYLDPFVYSRIDFTHSDQQRNELSRKWCQKQTKGIRPQDLEPFKCLEMKQISLNDDTFCLDPFVRNSCLIMSVSMGSNRIDDSFLNELYQWGGCRIFTFDPYQPLPSNSSSSDVMINVKPNWISYRLGLTASAAVDDHSNLMTINKLAEFIHLESISARIDILHLDIDNANEWNLLDDNDFFLYLCRHVKQLIVKTKPIFSKRFQHYRIYTLKLNRCFALLRRRSRLYFLGRHNQLESEWTLTTFSLNLGLFCDEIDLSMYLLIYGHLSLVNTKL